MSVQQNILLFETKFSDDVRMKIAFVLVLATTIVVAQSAPSQSSALSWLSWEDIRAMTAEGAFEFKKEGHLVRPGRFPGNIHGGRFICRAAVGDKHYGKGEN